MPNSHAAPKQAPTNLEVRILTATMAYATWTGVPNTVEATQGKRLGYKVSIILLTDRGVYFYKLHTLHAEEGGSRPW